MTTYRALIAVGGFQLEDPLQPRMRTAVIKPPAELLHVSQHISPPNNREGRVSGREALVSILPAANQRTTGAIYRLALAAELFTGRWKTAASSSPLHMY